MRRSTLAALWASIVVLAASLIAIGATRRPVIIAIGDSLTRGAGVESSDVYPARLENRLRKEGYRYKVINEGINGQTSTGALAKADWSRTEDPDIVILETGINDALNCVDPELIRANISKSVRLLREQDTTVVLAGIRTPRDCGPGYSTAFQEIYRTVAAEHKTILVPDFLEGLAETAELTQEDGLHPTADGYGVIVQTIYPHVMEAIERQRLNSDTR